MSPQCPSRLLHVGYDRAADVVLDALQGEGSLRRKRGNRPTGWQTTFLNELRERMKGEAAKRDVITGGLAHWWPWESRLVVLQPVAPVPL